MIVALEVGTFGRKPYEHGLEVRFETAVSTHLHDSVCGCWDSEATVLPPERHPASFAPWSTPYIACTRATATKPTMTPTKMIMIGSNIVVNLLIRLSSSRSK